MLYDVLLISKDGPNSFAASLGPINALQLWNMLSMSGGGPTAFARTVSSSFIRAY